MPTTLNAFLDRLERSESIDRLATPLNDAAAPMLRREPVSRLLSGAWMGHRLHPLLTDAVIGSWLSASVLDAVGGETARPHATRLVGLGILASAPTAVTGAHDWVNEPTKVRRSGFVHSMANMVGLGLQVGSWFARRRGAHRTGVLLSTGAMAVTGAGGYLGGHLTYVLGAGVDRTAFDDAPAQWWPTIPLDQLDDRKVVDVDGTAVLLVRDGAEIRALADTCSHLGCSLGEGQLTDGTVTCGCHGSRFRLSDGTVLAGPAASAQRSFAARVRGGVIEVGEG